jgi:hypothetical protein
LEIVSIYFRLCNCGQKIKWHLPRGYGSYHKVTLKPTVEGENEFFEVPSFFKLGA